ncbi:Glycosyl-phosphatidyl inositol-anchored, plant [Corchorus olitorius]|uniref:Glycosyl-phosphatidyl inositol-anchored, plant n=1 Tax=Corchorus olitorius TaxID=93759 RepID=A0A1R3K3D0_9ROSI|nr:Glycosyl-phosphatidyl inositol-anchored, plant [Corchorus olitorius]
MQGAEATEQGNCTRFKGGALPHCCEKTPAIVDLLPGAPYNMQTSNCCKGGVLTSMVQDSSKYVSVFQMNIGAGKDSDFAMPENFTLGIPGYSCGAAFRVAPSRYSSDGGRRWTQALVAAAKDCRERNVQSKSSYISQSKMISVWGNTSIVAAAKRSKSGATIISQVFAAYVPNKDPLACETKLQRILEGEDNSE